MKFVFNTFILALKCVKTKIVTLFLILAMAVLLCLAIVFFTENTLDEEIFTLNIGVVNLDKNDTTEKIIGFLSSTNEIKKRFNIERIETVEEANLLIENNELTGCVVLPRGFLDSVLYGENKPAQLITNNSNTIEKNIINTMAESLAQVMVDTQSAIYVTIDQLHIEEKYLESQILSINLDYVLTLLAMLDTFNSSENEIEYTNILSLVDEYTISIGLYLMLLSTVLFYKEMNFKSEILLLQQIKTLRNDYQLLYVTKLFVIVFAYFVCLLLIGYILQADFDFTYVVSQLNVAVFLVIIQSCLFNLCRKYIPAVQVNFVVNTFFLVIAGGIIPTVFLPEILADLERFSPITYMKNLMSVGLISSDTIAFDNTVLMGMSGGLFVVLYLCNRKSMS